jgi:hypothetical protein
MEEEIPKYEIDDQMVKANQPNQLLDLKGVEKVQFV